MPLLSIDYRSMAISPDGNLSVVHSYATVCSVLESGPFPDRHRAGPGIITPMSCPAPSRRSLALAAACLFLTAGCADAGDASDEAQDGDASTTTGTAASHGGPTVSGSVTGSSSMASAHSVTSSTQVTASAATSSATTGATGATTGSSGTTADDSTSASTSTSSSSGTTGAGGTTGSVTGTGTGTGGTPNECPPEPPLEGGQEYCDKELKQDVGNGYGFEIWSEQMGSGCITIYGQEAAFGASWNNVEDFLARVGLNFNQTQTHQQIGNLVADFAHTLTEEGGGLTYVGIYGWTVEPLVEYYILDDWGETKPAGTASDGTPRTHEGTITVDGATYDVWSKFRENKPSIIGDADFYQYFSIRETARKCGRISISEHFRQWEELGIDLGKFHEVKWLAESQNNSGSIEFTKATVVVE